MIGEAVYSETRWPTIRNAVETALEQHKPHTSYGFGEVDVTRTVGEIARLRREERIAVSFHAFAIHCLARAAVEHPGVLTYRRGRKLLTFHEADVSTTIEKFIHGVRMPAIYTFRAAEKKSLAETCWELRMAINRDQAHTEEVKWRRGLTRLPRPVRSFIGWRVRRDPLLLRRYHGNIGITTVGDRGFRQPFLGFPPSAHTYTLGLGTVCDRVEIDLEGRPFAKKVLFIAGGADHMVIDGMGLSRFGQRLFELLNDPTPMRDGFAEEMRRLQGERRI